MVIFTANCDVDDLHFTRAAIFCFISSNIVTLSPSYRRAAELRAILLQLVSILPSCSSKTNRLSRTQHRRFRAIMCTSKNQFPRPPSGICHNVRTIFRTAFVREKDVRSSSISSKVDFRQLCYRFVNFARANAHCLAGRRALCCLKDS